MLASGAESAFCSRVPLSYFSTLARIESLRTEVMGLDDEGLKAAVADLRLRRAEGAALQSLIPETFALVREACRRTLGKEHRGVQLLAGMALVDRAVAQLRTGEGKTLVAALSAVLFALDGKGCHVATTNGYLAERDRETLAPLYAALGLTVGVARFGQTPQDKRAAYAADITYAHADTLGFDWLDDQLVYRPEWRVQRGLAYAIVDEADDVLLDTAEQPMVLCGAPETDEELEARKSSVGLAYEIADELETGRDVRLFYTRERWRPRLTDEGIVSLESALARRLAIDPSEAWSAANAPLIHEVSKALEARYAVRAGEQYIGADDNVVLVSATTGHLQPGSRLRHGLMDAVMRKEGRDLERELSPAGLIGYPSFFNMYGHLSGMTGTARHGRKELRDNYGLSVIEIPPHKPSRRDDLPDLFFPHPAPRLCAALADAIQRIERGQPVLISTDSVADSKSVSERLADPLLVLADLALSSQGLLHEASRRLGPITGGTERERHAHAVELLRADPSGARSFADFLEGKGVPARAMLGRANGVDHRLLNAETEAKEAAIIARAGERGALTIATQMAGRGTDIALAEGVEELGGLHVLCIGHKANRRKDEQAIGRGGRHGERGSSQFFVAPTDAVFSFLPARVMRDLCRDWRGDEIRQPSGAFLRRLRRSIVDAQERAEVELAHARTINSRFDAVFHLKRRGMLAERDQVLESRELPERVHHWLLEDLASAREISPDAVRSLFRDLDPDICVPDAAGREALDALLAATLERQIARTRVARGEDDDAFRQYVRDMFLYTMDRAWISFLEERDELVRQALHATRDPFSELAFSASDRFELLRAQVRDEIVSRYKFHLRTHAAAKPQG
jgi:preprotein translocase subunit SecA